MKLNEATLRLQMRQLTAEARDHDENAEECGRLIDLLRIRGGEARLELEALLGIARYHRVQSLKKGALARSMRDQLRR
jgi:hypothetical protein